MPIGIEIEKALIVSVASVMFPELLTLSSTMYPTEIVAAPADVDKVTPRPSSSAKPVLHLSRTVQHHQLGCRLFHL